MKHSIAVILFAILAAGCATQSANPDSNLVARVEQSKDGRISKEEYTTWNVARMFRLYDGGKGYVTIEDWRRLEGPSRDAVFRRIDANHNGKVTLAEAEANSKVRALLGGNFADIDTNHDGWIDRKEAEAYLARRQAYTP
jgi:Ca2+-binding EF-hand superfamily protein